MRLYTVVGNGDNQRLELEDSIPTKTGVGKEIGNTDSTGCFPGVSARWIASLEGKTDIGNLVPYPAWSAVRTWPCG